MIGRADNLRELYETATEYDIVEGKQAYARYHATLHRFANYYGFGIVPTVEAFAALSPNNDYHGNLRSLASVLEFAARPHPESLPKVSTYQVNATRALGYITGTVSFLDTVKGQKITAFRHNLLYPETSKQVTVDGHIMLAWLGINGTMKDAAAKMSTMRYHAIARDIVTLARAEGMLPCQMQATLWITRKRLLDIKMGVTQREGLFGKNTDAGGAQARPEDFPPYGIKDINRLTTEAALNDLFDA